MQNIDSIKQSVRRTYGQVLWTHKIHEKQADIYAEQYKWLEVFRIVTSCVTSAGVITLIFNDTFAIKVVAVIVSVVAACLTAFFTAFNLQKMSEQHRQAAIKLLTIRERIHLLLLKIKIQRVSDDEALSEYENIICLLGEIYDSAPSTTDKAVKRARKAMGLHGDNEITDEEINSGLPEDLKE